MQVFKEKLWKKVRIPSNTICAEFGLETVTKFQFVKLISLQKVLQLEIGQKYRFFEVLSS